MLGEKVKGLRRKKTLIHIQQYDHYQREGGGLRRQERGKGDKW